MAKGFMPSDEATDANYERLNRLLLELREFIYHLSRSDDDVGEDHQPRQHQQTQNQRVRPVSDSSAPSRLPDLLCDASPPRRRISSQRSTPSSPSCSSHCRNFADLYDRNLQDSPYPVDDEVFFASPTLSTSRIQSAAPPRPRRRRKRTNSLKERKSNRINKADEMTDIGSWNDGHVIKSIEVDSDEDTVDSPPSREREKVRESDSSLISNLLSTSLGGSLWTAVFIVVGWKLLINKR